MIVKALIGGSEPWHCKNSRFEEENNGTGGGLGRWVRSGNFFFSQIITWSRDRGKVIKEIEGTHKRLETLPYFSLGVRYIFVSELLENQKELAEFQSTVWFSGLLQKKN